MKLQSKFALAILASLLAVVMLSAQKVTEQRKLAWQAPVKMRVSDELVVDYLVFEGSVNLQGYGRIPCYSEYFDLSGGNNDFNITITEVETTPLSPAEQAALTPLPAVPEKVVPTKGVSYQNKIAKGFFSFVAIIKNPTLNRYEKVTSFSYTVTGFTVPKAKSNASFTTNSVLQSGRWYKIAIVNDGIYKIDKAFLTSLGMDANVNPNNIRVYGSGGGMLPTLNSAPRIDDLGEIAIEVTGAGDNSFDANDYLLFYGKGQERWNYDGTNSKFTHVVNAYCDTAYYFITADLGVGKRISNQASSNATPTATVTTFTDYALHEKDEINLIHSGSVWLGEKFDIINDYAVNFSFPNIDLSTPVKITTSIAANYQSNSSAIFKIKLGSTEVGQVNVSGIGTNPLYLAGHVSVASTAFNASSSSIALTVTKNTSNCEGWLDYMEIIVKRNLSFSGSQMLFRNIDNIGSGQVTKYILSNANSVRVWDITDHQNVAQQALNNNSGNADFTLPTDVLRNFIAFNGSSYSSPISIGSVNNQNLHATGQVDMVIVSAPEFISQANQLADLHRNNDNMDVLVTTPQAIYNEFSSGARDILAIRSFMRMLYVRAQNVDEQPKYLLLYGDGSYDNKYRVADNTPFLPTYQTEESMDIIGSQTADDYYGLLDDSEGEFNIGEAIDIGIGRIPCKTAQEAQTVLVKIKDYTNTEGQRDWRNSITFFADDQDGGAHLSQADQLSKMFTEDVNVTTVDKAFTIEKVYFDAYMQESTAGGQRYPEVKDILDKRVDRGGLIINYTGHGGEAGWAAEKVLELSDIESWTNKTNLPAFVTATCEFSKFDDPSRTTAGELVLINDKGGICLFTTTRVVYSSPNFTLNTKFYLNLLTKIKAGELPRMGDLYKATKVATANDGNSRNFALLGDPALRLNYPVHDVVTTEINNQTVTPGVADTIKALQIVTVKGYIKSRTAPGVLSNYNGTIYPTVYDKAITVQTLGQDPDSPTIPFKVQRNIIYKGKASVVNGLFTFTFPVPKDISYQYGYGKINYYAENGVRDQDAHGYQEVVIGGTDTSSTCDNQGPNITLYMNDTKFANGGTTDANPSLLVYLTDTNGINTVGTGIGHDLVAILDNNTIDPYLLNEYYEADLNSYTRGKATYPFSGLKDGPHTLRVKAWDICNNSNEATIDFVVARTADLALNHVLNYPNPFTTNTCFMFEHNRPNQVLDVQVQVFTVSGKVVKSINTTMSTTGYRTDCISWDGLDDYGDKIGRGVYIYRLKITDESGKKADKYEKLVILN